MFGGVALEVGVKPPGEAGPGVGRGSGTGGAACALGAAGAGGAVGAAGGGDQADSAGRASTVQMSAGRAGGSSSSLPPKPKVLSSGPSSRPNAAIEKFTTKAASQGGTCSADHGVGHAHRGDDARHELLRGRGERADVERHCLLALRLAAQPGDEPSEHRAKRSGHQRCEHNSKETHRAPLAFTVERSENPGNARR